MRRNWIVVLVVAVMLAVVPLAFANTDTAPGLHKVKTVVTNTNTNTNTNVNMNVNSNTNLNANYNTNKQSQNQGQIQGQAQGQKQSVNNGQTIAPNQVINEAKQVLAAPEINPFYLMPMQGGKVGDVTKTMPQFVNKALVPLSATDRVLQVLDVYFGNIFSRITYEEVESYLLSKADKYKNAKIKIRYTVKYQDSVITSGMGGGAALSGSGGDGTMSSSGSILPGVSKSTANPIFIITFYEVI